MSLENFMGLDSGEMSEAAFEALRERMGRASQQIAAIRKEEVKQKKKEDELRKILLKFIQSSHKSQLVALVSHVLALNIPAHFILAIILLGNQEIQLELKTFLLAAPQQEASADDKSLIFFGANDASLPLKVRITMDSWLKNLLEKAEEKPQKLLKSSYKKEVTKIKDEDSAFGEEKYETKQYIQKPLIHLTAFVVQDFLAQNQIQEDSDKLESFAEFILQGILTKTEENLNNRPELSAQNPSS